MPRIPTATPAPGSLGRTAAGGAAITMVGQVARILIQIGTVAVLARLVTPAETGHFAMLMAVVGVSEIFRDFGLSNAAIQARTLSTAQRTQLFWVNTAIGGALSILVFLAAPLVAFLYSAPHLAPLVMGIAATFAFNGLQTQHRADLNRQLRFRALTVIDVVSPLVGSLVAIAVAFAGGGTWALVAQTVTIAVVSFALVLPVGGWLPGLPRRGVDMGGFYRFGWNMVATQLVNYLAKNMDVFVISYRFGAGSVGLYSRVFTLLMNPLQQIRAPFSRVAIPVLSRIQDDRKRFDDYLVRAQLVMGYTIVPLLAFIGGAALPIVTILLGDAWLDSTPVLQFLTVAGVFSTLAFVAYWAFVTQNLTGQLFRFTLVTAGLKILCIVIGSQWGIAGVAAGFALEPLLSWPLAIWWLSRSAPTPVARLCAGAGRVGALALTASGAAWVATLWLSGLSPWLQIPLAFIATCAVYAAASAIPTVRRDLRELMHVVRLVFLSRGRPQHPAHSHTTAEESPAS
ncbi:MAG: lipopolysaccharide biosynthesis protein [Mycetocola sp.]